MGEGVAFKEFLAGLSVENRRALTIVKQTLDQVRGRGEILKPLLVLNSDGRTAEFIRQTHRGNIHLQLLQCLPSGQFSFFVLPPSKGETLTKKPAQGNRGFGRLHREHRGKQA